MRYSAFWGHKLDKVWGIWNIIGPGNRFWFDLQLRLLIHKLINHCFRWLPNLLELYFFYFSIFFNHIIYIYTPQWSRCFWLKAKRLSGAGWANKPFRNSTIQCNYLTFVIRRLGYSETRQQVAATVYFSHFNLVVDFESCRHLGDEFRGRRVTTWLYLAAISPNMSSQQCNKSFIDQQSSMLQVREQIEQ